MFIITIFLLATAVCAEDEHFFIYAESNDKQQFVMDVDVDKISKTCDKCFFIGYHYMKVSCSASSPSGVTLYTNKDCTGDTNLKYAIKSKFINNLGNDYYKMTTKYGEEVSIKFWSVETDPINNILFTNGQNGIYIHEFVEENGQKIDYLRAIVKKGMTTNGEKDSNGVMRGIFTTEAVGEVETAYSKTIIGNWTYFHSVSENEYFGDITSDFVIEEQYQRYNTPPPSVYFCNAGVCKKSSMGVEKSDVYDPAPGVELIYCKDKDNCGPETEGVKFYTNYVEDIIVKIGHEVAMVKHNYMCRSCDRNKQDILGMVSHNRILNDDHGNTFYANIKINRNDKLFTKDAGGQANGQYSGNKCILIDNKHMKFVETEGYDDYEDKAFKYVAVVEYSDDNCNTPISYALLDEEVDSFIGETSKTIRTVTYYEEPQRCKSNSGEYIGRAWAEQYGKIEYSFFVPSTDGAAGEIGRNKESVQCDTCVHLDDSNLVHQRYCYVECGATNMAIVVAFLLFMLFF